MTSATTCAIVAITTTVVRKPNRPIISPAIGIVRDGSICAIAEVAEKTLPRSSSGMRSIRTVVNKGLTGPSQNPPIAKRTRISQKGVWKARGQYANVTAAKKAVTIVRRENR